MTAPERFTIVLLSGGIDSTVALTDAVRDGGSIIALSVDYGQRHRKELDAAKKVATTLGVFVNTLVLNAFSEMAWHSGLTRMRYALEMGKPPVEGVIPASYVPMRNTFLLTTAAALLESKILSSFEEGLRSPAVVSARIVVGANADDFNGYPDCRPDFYRAMEDVLYRGSRLGAQYGISILIETPLIKMTKSAIIRYGMELGAPLIDTWSCYLSGDRPCDTCDACRLRRQGFGEVGLPDPAFV